MRLALNCSAAISGNWTWRSVFAAPSRRSSDYGSARLGLLLLGLGAQRLDHLRYLVNDPLVARFCGLARIPAARTVSNWLKQFTQTTPAPLVQLKHDLVVETLAACRLPRLTRREAGKSG